MPEKIASIQGEFTIEFAKTAGGLPLISAQKVVYLSGKADERLNAPKIWTHVFQAYDRSVYADLNEFVSSTKIPIVWIRYGITSGNQGKMTDWEPHTIVDVQSTLSRTADTSHGDYFTMTTADLLYVMQKDERVASRKGRVSNIAQAIASTAGFQKFAVEQTDLDYALVQSFQSDYDFLVSRLIPMASNKESSSNFLMFARGELFHFHTLNYQLAGFYEFDFGVNTNSTTDVSLTNLGNNNSILQINGMKLVAYDPLTGTTTNWETKPERELVLSDTSPARAGTSYYKGHVGQNQLASLYAESQWQYVIDKTSAYGTSFTVDNYPYVGVADIVSSSILRGQGDQWEGFYMVKSITRIIDNARIVCRYNLVRGEYISPSGSNVTGKKLSAAGIEASGVTSNTSGGFKLGQGSVVEVNDPTR